MADVTIDADEAVPEARVVPVDIAALDDDTMVVPDVAAALEARVEVASDDSGVVEGIEEVTVDASVSRALDIAEPSDDSICEAVPAVVLATWVAAAARAPSPDGLVFCTGVGIGVSADAVDDAPE